MFLDEDSSDMMRANEEDSQVQKFYQNSHIFVTGASGFLGCLLIEKLLRACPNLDHLYLLMRSKKDKSPAERLNQLFNDPVFEKLRNTQRNFADKITIINGDCGLPNLGLETEDVELLQQRIDCVFHCAATIRFDEKLRTATNINVRCTRDLIFMARNMTKLKAFVYVSTAYSNCIESEVNEIFYKPPMTSDRLIEICNCLNDEQLELLTPKFIDKWPNTYAFTKVIAENAIETYGNHIPVTIVRPSIIFCTYKEPICGWINNYFGPVGLTIGAGTGIIHCMYGEKSNLTDMVPADYVVNSLIVAAWQIGMTQENNSDIQSFDIEPNGSIPIYNYVSSTQNPLTWDYYIQKFIHLATFWPLSNAVMHVYFVMIPNRFLFILFAILTQFIPGLFFDTILLIMNKKPIFYKIYRNFYKISQICAYFTLKQWQFHNNNIQILWRKMNMADKRLFEFDMSALDWNTYFYYSIRGSRVYLLNDTMETIYKAKRRQIILKIVHYFFIGVACYLLYQLFSLLFI